MRNKSRSLVNYKKLVKKANEIKRGYKPTPVFANITYVNQLLDGTTQKRKWERALKIFEKLEKRNAKLHISNYRKFIYSIGYRGRQPEKAREIFDLAIKRVKTDEKDRILYNTMIHSYAIKGNYQEASKLFQEYKDDSRPNAFTVLYLLKAYKKAPKEEAEKLDSLLHGISTYVFENKYVKNLYKEIKESQKPFIEEKLEQ